MQESKLKTRKIWCIHFFLNRLCPFISSRSSLTAWPTGNFMYYSHWPTGKLSNLCSCRIMWDFMQGYEMLGHSAQDFAEKKS